MQTLAILDFIFPYACMSCLSIDIEADHFFCADCWKNLVFIRAPLCFTCGAPFAFSEDFNNLGDQKRVCTFCEKKKPYFDEARSLFVYNAQIRKPLLRFKKGDKTQYSRFLSSMLVHFFKDFINSVDYIIPVPLHRKRLFQRQYNQAALLANYIGKFTKKNVFYDILYRSENTAPQDHKSRIERFQNMENVFQVLNEEKTKGKCILLIDDVMTTGATLHECAKVLKSSGVGSVKTLCVARSVPWGALL
jgi:competence protein ComFC